MHERSGENMFWSIENSGEVLSKLPTKLKVRFI